MLLIAYTSWGVALFRPVAFSFSDYWLGLMTVTGYLTGAISYGELEPWMPFWGGVYIVSFTIICLGFLTAYVSFSRCLKFGMLGCI